MVSVTRARLRGSVVVALFAAALVVAGCGSASSSSSSNAPAANSSPASSAPSGSGGGIAISTTKGSNGTYLTGPSGRALYLWVADRGDKSSCMGACAQAWPPLITKSTPAAPKGVNAADIGTINRPGGGKQVTYKGHPLYYFVGDSGAGMVTGQGSNEFGAKWWLVAPSGTAITASTSSGGSSSGGTSYGSSSSGGSSSGSSSSGGSSSSSWG
jgi:predicted lipoprotein with Yx(FWY)xxD motif